MKDIKEYLKGREDIKELFVNEAGEWLRHPRAGFAKMTRAEILAEAKTAEKKADKPEKKAEAKTAESPSKNS